MSAFQEAQEAFNRASHSDALAEMQIATAEEIQPVERPTPRNILASIPAQDFFIAVGATATLWFIAAALSVILPGA